MGTSRRLENKLHAAILGAGFGIVRPIRTAIRLYRATLTKGANGEASRIDAIGRQRLANGLGAPLRKRLIELAVAHIIGVSIDEDLSIAGGRSIEHRRHISHSRLSGGGHFRSPESKEHVLGKNDKDFAFRVRRYRDYWPWRGWRDGLHHNERWRRRSGRWRQGFRGFHNNG